VLVMPFYSGLDRLTSLSDVHLATVTGDATHTCSPQTQIALHRTEEDGDLPQLQANPLDVVCGQHSAEVVVCHLTYGRRATEVGLSLGFEVLTINNYHETPHNISEECRSHQCCS
jgi:hypothetical protein